MKRAATIEWTQIDLTRRNEATAQRVTAVLVALSGIGGFVLSLRMIFDWWLVALVLLGCLVIVALGVGLWINPGVGAGAVSKLKESGTPASLPVVAAHKTTDESIRYQLQLRMPSADDQFVMHACGEPGCIEAGRTAPDSEVAALLNDATKTWAVVHDSPRA
ncbi:hypothetical protein [Microbacterium aurantiacum]|uniref:hypothetical protein n=1 Tax=Microbacterium aurantiacum TaxID=162393 RepID=UPI000C80381C|nr:hypothetical protein [Microbacterium aurantiacum]